MVDISNKTLALLMVAAIVVSLGGLFISLDRLGRLEGSLPLTGYVPNNFTFGKANVTIASTAAMALRRNDTINFGTCTQPGTGYVVVSSNGSGENGGSGGNCTRAEGDFTGDNITIQNTGNVYLNVTVKTNETAAQFLGSSASSSVAFAFKTENDSTAAFAGCMDNKGANIDKHTCSGSNCCDEAINRSATGNCTLTRSWTNISTVDQEYKVCENLTFANNKKNITFYAQIQIPSDLSALGHESRIVLNFSGYTLT